MGAFHDVSSSAAVGCVDLAAFDQNGDAVDIYPCHVCSPWHAEVVVTELGEVLVREWHSVECSVFQDLINEDEAPSGRRARSTER